MLLFLQLLGLIAFGAVSADLPPYSGPYSVGTVDIEVPARYLSGNISQGTLRSGQPAFQFDTVLFSLFYPTTSKTSDTSKQHPWVPQPLDLLANGFAQYAASSGTNVSAQLIQIGLNSIASSVYIPAEVDAPLLSGSQSFPIVIFSHGDAGTRTFYSEYLGELASRGTIVAAIEHRDGSCPGSVVEKKDGLRRNVTYFSNADVSPPMSYDQFKLAQRAFREAEVMETYYTLIYINLGYANYVYGNNSRNEGTSLTDWRGRLQFNQLVMAGHSFGATTALQVLRPDITWVYPPKGGIIFDPGKSSGPLETNISLPLLIADSESWSSTPSDFYGQQHFDVVKGIAQTSSNRSDGGWFITLLGASHATLTDVALISPAFVSFFDSGFNTTINATVGIAKYVEASQQFLTFLGNSSARGNILSSPVTDPEWDQSSNASGVPAEVSQYWQIHVASIKKRISTSQGNKVISHPSSVLFALILLVGFSLFNMG